jgi:endothelin-converting enzyme
MLTKEIDIDTLFSWAIEGNVGVDPNFMTLWFYQGGLSLPSKVHSLIS